MHTHAHARTCAPAQQSGTPTHANSSSVRCRCRSHRGLRPRVREPRGKKKNTERRGEEGRTSMRRSWLYLAKRSDLPGQRTTRVIEGAACTIKHASVLKK